MWIKYIFCGSSLGNILVAYYIQVELKVPKKYDSSKSSHQSIHTCSLKLVVFGTKISFPFFL